MHKQLTITKTLGLAVCLMLINIPTALASCSGLLDFESKKLHSSKTVDFCEAFEGKTLLVVNTASQCGFTPQFKELEALYQKYKGEGLEIVGFPSNSFRQEFQDEKDTAAMCFKNYGVSFTMLAPSEVRGNNQNAFYKALYDRTAKVPEWNFHKFLISSDQASVVSYTSNVRPLNSRLEEDLEKLLN